MPIPADKLRRLLVLLFPRPAPALARAAAGPATLAPAAAAAANSSAPSSGGLVGTREAFRINNDLKRPGIDANALVEDHRGGGNG